jgi:outer membrane protein W
LATIYGSIDMDGSANALVLAPGVAYHFIPQNSAAAVVPYVGAGLAYGRVDGFGDSDSSMKLQYFVGAKCFIGGDYKTSNKAVFIEYRHTNIDLFDTDIKLDLVWAGLSCFF